MPPSSPLPIRRREYPIGTSVYVKAADKFSVNRLQFGPAFDTGPSRRGAFKGSAQRSIGEVMFTPSEHAAREERKTIAYSAAAIFEAPSPWPGMETALPDGPENSILPGIGALAFVAVAIVAGPRMPRQLAGRVRPTRRGGASPTPSPRPGRALRRRGPLHVAGAVDVLLLRPRGRIFIVASVAVAQGAVLANVPPSEAASIDRWIEVVASVTVVAAVVQHLAGRNARLVKDLDEQARVDPLTGLLNRRGLEERMNVEVRRALRNESQMAVAIVDVDNFKQLNDEHGHEVGDRVLTWLGAVLAGRSRGIDVAARTGGDEFVILLTDSDTEAAERFADRVRQAIDQAGDQGERGRHGLPPTLELTVSVGVAAAERATPSG